MTFKGLATKEVMRLTDILPQKKGQVISQNLVMNNRCDIRMFSFDVGEEVSLQTSKADIMYWLLEGEGEILFEKGNIPIAAGQAVVAGHGTANGIKALTPIKAVQIGIYEKENEMGSYIKNLEHRKAIKLADVLDYEDNKVSSMTLAQNEKLSLTLMSLDKNEAISTHASGGDAMVQVLDGSVQITIDKDVFLLNKGDSIIMPANVPHSLKAVERFKMFLTVVKE